MKKLLKNTMHDVEERSSDDLKAVVAVHQKDVIRYANVRPFFFNHPSNLPHTDIRPGSNWGGECCNEWVPRGRFDALELRAAIAREQKEISRQMAADIEDLLETLYERCMKMKGSGSKGNALASSCWRTLHCAESAIRKYSKPGWRR